MGGGKEKWRGPIKACHEKSETPSWSGDRKTTVAAMGWRSVWLCFLVLPLIEVQARLGKSFKLSKSYQAQKFSLCLSLFSSPNVNVWIQKDLWSSAFSAATNKAIAGQPLTICILLLSFPVRNHVSSICSTWGSQHFKTFDGDVFQFPGMCEYNLVSNCHRTFQEFSVHMRRKENHGSPTVSHVVVTINELTVYLSRTVVTVDDMPWVVENFFLFWFFFKTTSLTKSSGSSIKLPYHNKGVQVEQNAVYIKLQSSVGIVVMWNRDDAVMVTIACLDNCLIETYFKLNETLIPQPTSTTTLRVGHLMSFNVSSYLTLFSTTLHRPHFSQGSSAVRLHQKGSM